MPWLEITKVKQRSEFIRAILSASMTMTAACGHFGISRPTGYKWLARYRVLGIEGLNDQRRAPKRTPHRTDGAVAAAVIHVRKTYPSWGPKKVRGFLRTKRPNVDWPAASTIGDILVRAGLVKARKRTRTRVPRSQPLANVRGPNDLWTMDFKGQFRLGDRTYCYPLTIVDAWSRMILACVALPSVRTPSAHEHVERVFERFGLPQRIRTDNGAPFASRGIAGLSTLSARWQAIGIGIERIEPGHPEQNGSHERMHLTLKRETTRPAAATMEGQQERFDDFIVYFNEIRPHEALGQKTPASLYAPSTSRWDEQAPAYEDCDLVRKVQRNGMLGIRGRRHRVHVGLALIGLEIGLTEEADGLWLLRLGPKTLAMYDEEDMVLSRIPEDGLTEFAPAEVPDRRPGAKRGLAQ